MTKRNSLIFRLVTELIIGVAALFGFMAILHSAYGANDWWAVIFFFSVVILAAGASGYSEPSAKMVWLHAPIMMLPELIGLPLVLTCHSFMCAPAAFLLFVALI